MDGLPGAAFLRAPASTNDHDLGLFEIGAAAGPSGAGRSTVGLYHLAWEVETLADLARDRRSGSQERGALVGATDHGTTKALYAKDPDGLEFEVSWLVPADLLTPRDPRARVRVGPARPAEARSSASAPTPVGGLGISVPPPPDPAGHARSHPRAEWRLPQHLGRGPLPHVGQRRGGSTFGGRRV